MPPFQLSWSCQISSILLSTKAEAKSLSYRRSNFCTVRVYDLNTSVINIKMKVSSDWGHYSRNDLSQMKLLFLGSIPIAHTFFLLPPVCSSDLLAFNASKRSHRLSGKVPVLVFFRVYFAQSRRIRNSICSCLENDNTPQRRLSARCSTSFRSLHSLLP